MARMTKEESERLEELKKNGTTKEKLQEILRDRASRINNSKPLLSKKAVTELLNSVPKEEIDKCNEYIRCINKLFSMRDLFMLHAVKLDYISQKIISYVKNVSNKVGQANLYNMILDESECLGKKRENTLEILKIAANNDEEAQIEYNEHEKHFFVYADKKDIDNMMREYIFVLKQAKSLSLALDLWKVEHDMEGLIPTDIVATMKSYEANHTFHKFIPVDYYPKLLKGKNIGFNKMVLETLKDTTLVDVDILPTFENMSPMNELLDNNIFDR